MAGVCRQRGGDVGQGSGRARRSGWWHLGALLLAAAASLAGGPAVAGPAIRWVLIDWAPLFRFDAAQPPTRAEELGDGVADRAMVELIARLPDYRHRFEVMSRRRLWLALSESEGPEAHCYAAMLRTPEREKRYYLVPWTPLPPPMLVLRAGLEPGAARPVMLAGLLARTELQGALEAQRSYGMQLDRLLGAQRALPREPVSEPGQLSRLVARGRYDYTLEYPLTVEHLRRSGRLGGEVQLLALAEAQEWPVAHVVCARNEAGRAAIQAIARAVGGAAQGRGLREALSGWLPPALQPLASARLEPFFDALAKGVAVVE